MEVFMEGMEEEGLWGEEEEDLLEGLGVSK